MHRALTTLVRQRAKMRCEYCQMPQAYDGFTCEIDHIIPTIHGEKSVASNLAFSCFLCNRHKGSNLAGVDPTTRKTTRLFHPRRHAWHRHFSWDGPYLVGKSVIGRATVRVLQINEYLRICHRRELIAEHVFPPRAL